jgi:hypothetical protein
VIDLVHAITDRREPLKRVDDRTSGIDLQHQSASSGARDFFRETTILLSNILVTSR